MSMRRRNLPNVKIGEREWFVMGHMAFRAEEYDAKIRQTLAFYEEF